MSDAVKSILNSAVDGSDETLAEGAAVSIVLDASELHAVNIAAKLTITKTRQINTRCELNAMVQIVQGVKYAYSSMLVVQ